MRLVLDAGALIAIDRNDRRVAGLVALGRRSGAELATSSAVVGQVWRDGARQANLARFLSMLDVAAVDLATAKRAGELLASAGSSDVVDAVLALVVRPGDQVLTSDPGDIGQLLSALRVPAAVVTV
jgi:hypothetical protein